MKKGPARDLFGRGGREQDDAQKKFLEKLLIRKRGESETRGSQVEPRSPENSGGSVEDLVLGIHSFPLFRGRKLSPLADGPHGEPHQDR